MTPTSQPAILAVKPSGLAVKTHKGSRAKDGSGLTAPLSWMAWLVSLWTIVKGGMFGSKFEVGKKVLRRDSADTYLLTLPLIFWGILIIGIYVSLHCNHYIFPTTDPQHPPMQRPTLTSPSNLPGCRSSA